MSGYKSIYPPIYPVDGFATSSVPQASDAIPDALDLTFIPSLEIVDITLAKSHVDALEQLHDEFKILQGAFVGFANEAIFKAKKWTNGTARFKKPKKVAVKFLNFLEDRAKEGKRPDPQQISEDVATSASLETEFSTLAKELQDLTEDLEDNGTQVLYPENAEFNILKVVSAASGKINKQSPANTLSLPRLAPLPVQDHAPPAASQKQSLKTNARRPNTKLLHIYKPSPLSNAVASKTFNIAPEPSPLKITTSKSAASKTTASEQVLRRASPRKISSQTFSSPKVPKKVIISPVRRSTRSKLNPKNAKMSSETSSSLGHPAFTSTSVLRDLTKDFTPNDPRAYRAQLETKLIQAAAEIDGKDGFINILRGTERISKLEADLKAYQDYVDELENKKPDISPYKRKIQILEQEKIELKNEVAGLKSEVNKARSIASLLKAQLELLETVSSGDEHKGLVENNAENLDDAKDLGNGEGLDDKDKDVQPSAKRIRSS